MTIVTKRIIAAIWLMVAVVTGGMATAQSTVWVQIEAQPTLAEAEARARAYAAAFPNIAGFRMRSGWYAIALGPYAPDDADRELAALKRERLVPVDSFIAFPQQFRQQFWPVGADTLNAPPVAPSTAADPAPEVTAEAGSEAEPRPEAMVEATPAPEPALPDETPAQARRSEAQLDRDGRALLQEALKWEGFYQGAIDAAFGPGTRRSMAEYQAARGYEPTGVLTTAQRRELVEGYRAEFSALGLAQLADDRAGIEVIAPLGLVQFDHVEPPFVHYTPSDDRGVRLLLISQSGDQRTLYGLYDILQTLTIVPPEGERSRSERSFVLRGENAEIQSYTYARLDGGAVKGFTLVWKPEDARIMNAVVEQMRESFTPTAAILPDTAGTGAEEQRVDLMAGLEIRTPELSRSGFYIDERGAVLTTTEVLGRCGKVTIDDAYEADIAARNDTLGLALLQPRQPLSPLGHARFAAATPRLKSEVAVAGYSYEDTLSLPTVTFGTLADLRGLNGEEGMQRLELSALPGDAGGPVIDQSGAVMGMLLARPADGSRQLPENVQFAASVPAIAAFLSAAGLSPAASESGSALAPEDITTLAEDMTVLVSCWE
ncbi:serine protease [Vannielia litorea]|uniref:Sporulation related domain-containing protein n=1 Tax=Vannielia litorea TaxID=1217970 RepID=A0A1N6EIQ7_9RHOB|nr:serine protease [Vannielia litorea]SIN82902.1 Sporulation related domain-containing protein [Vannielia litorea]